MSRIRTIKPGFFRSLSIADLDIGARLTFVGLWTYVDDKGRGVDDARLLKAEIWPLDDRYAAKKVEVDLKALEKHDHICRYQADGSRYLHVVKWKAHQVINRPQPSQHPPCPIHDNSRNDHGTDRDAGGDDSLNVQGIISERSWSTHDARRDGSGSGSGSGSGREKDLGFTDTHDGDPQAVENRDPNLDKPPHGNGTSPADVPVDPLLVRLEAVCTADHRPKVRLGAIEVLAWAKPHLAAQLIDEAIGAVATLPKPPVMPAAVVPLIERKAADNGIHLPPFRQVGTPVDRVIGSIYDEVGEVQE